MHFVAPRGMTKAAYAALEKVFPYKRPDPTETLEQIQRREGQKDVLEYLKDKVVV